MRIRVFIEYKIQKKHYETYLNGISDLKKELAKRHAEHIQVYEGADQPYLFVEAFDVKRMEDYEKLKDERLNEEHEIWKRLHRFIEGGTGKLHIWAFMEVE